MSFLAPLFLLGGLAIALPVAFHLVRRSSREKQIFSSLMFLQPTPPRLTRRNRLEHIFLLLLRCLAIAVLALGFARPFLQKPMAATPTNNAGAQVVILVDTSASMKRDGVWAAALNQADTALKQTTPADQVALLTFDNQVRTVVSFEQWAAMNVSERVALASQRLAELKPTWHATHLGDALIAAADRLEDADKRELHSGPRRIVLISDLQEGSRLEGLQGHEWPRGLEVVVEPVKAKRPSNAGLQWVAEADDSARTTATPVRLRVSNSANAQREQFKIQWDGVPDAASLDAYVPPGQSRIVPAPKIPTNTVAGRITLTGDDDAFDNTAYVVQPQAEQVNVLFLGNEAETDSAQSLYYLKRAFQDTRRQAVRLTTPLTRPSATLSPSDGERDGVRGALATSRLVIISSTTSEEVAGSVYSYLTNGGTALLVMNDAQAANTLGQLTGTPEVTATEAAVANYAMFGQMDFTHPLFAPFADPRFGDFTKIRFWKHRTLATGRLLGVRVIASYDDNDPAILEIPVGRGRVFVFTSSWRPADSQLALSSKFVPLLYSLLDQAGGSRPPPAQFQVGDTVDLSAFIGSRRREEADTTGAPGNPPPHVGGYATIRLPDGASVQLDSGKTRFTQTDLPGIYEILGQPPVRFAVNLAASESKTAPLAGDELERLGLPMKTPEVAAALTVAKQQTLHNAELEARQKLWRWLIVAALAVLLIETWLAGWITRRSAAPLEAVP